MKHPATLIIVIFALIVIILGLLYFAAAEYLSRPKRDDHDDRP